jgi:hypothetical protein
MFSIFNADFFVVTWWALTDLWHVARVNVPLTLWEKIIISSESLHADCFIIKLNQNQQNAKSFSKLPQIRQALFDVVLLKRRFK